MTSRLPKHLFDALSAIRLAREFTAGVSFDAYCASALVRSAVERQLEVLGEACCRMAQEDASIKDRIAEIGFAIGLRNRIIHGYDRIENALIFDTLVKDLPMMSVSLQAELDRFAPPDEP